MVSTTRAQREALKKVFDRTPLYDVTMLFAFLTILSQDSDMVSQFALDHYRITYRQFRKTVQPGYDCIMVKWCGMWLGIERDGYTHS